MLDVVTALTTRRTCPCDCEKNLSASTRAAGISAVYVLDDALRGWGYLPTYEVHGDRLFREAQQRNDPTYRGVAVRFGECIHRRLLGSLLHECIHAVSGDTAAANYGVPFGLPYGVPESLAEKDEAAFLEPFNVGEARAFAGVWIVGRCMFGIDWDLRTARDVGTYGFSGGNALVKVPKGFRAVAHIDRQHHAERYYARARRLEDDARAWFASGDNLASVVARILAASKVGFARRPKAFPAPEALVRTAPKKIGRNEPCVCGSGTKFKDCCERRGQLAHFLPVNAR